MTKSKIMIAVLVAVVIGLDPEGYECVYDKDDEDVIDRAGECKRR